jgi:biopolymer transport protein ExbD
VNLPELRGELDKLLALPHPPKLALAADKRAPVGMLIAVLDVLKQAGVKGELAAFTEKAQP